MNAPGLVINYVLVLVLLLINSTLSLGQWYNISPVSHSSNANLYRTQFYGYKHDLQKSSWPNVRLIDYPSQTNIQRPVYGSYHSLKRKSWTPRPWIRYDAKSNNYLSPIYVSRNRVKPSAAQLQNGFGNGLKALSNPFATKENLNYRRSPYNVNYQVKPAFLTSQQNRVASRRKFPSVNYNLKGKIWSRVFHEGNYIFKQEHLASGRQNVIGNRKSAVWVPHPNKNIPEVQPSQISYYEAKRNFLTPQPQNAFGNRRKVSAPASNRYKRPVFLSSPYKRKFVPQSRRNILRPPHNARRLQYQIRSQVSNQKVKTANISGSSPEANSVVNSPYGRSIKPKISQWLLHVRHIGIPYTREMKKSPVPGFGPSSGSVESTSSYRSQSNAERRMIEPISSQNSGAGYFAKDTALQDVLSKVNPREDQLIPEYVPNQMGPSRSSGLAYAMEREQRPVPRKSYVSENLAEGNRLNDPQLIKLKQILQSMRKRNIAQANSENENLHFKLRLHSDAKQRVQRSSSLDPYNSMYKAEKFNSQNVNGRKSSIRKVKGRQHWGFINEFSPNVRLASMILLKQKRHSVRKKTIRDLAGFSGNRPEEGSVTAKRRAKVFAISGHNRRVENVQTNRGDDTETLLTADVKYGRKYNESSKLGSKRKHRRPRKRNKKINRSFVRNGNDAFFFYPTGTYLNSQFSPLGTRVPRQRYLSVFFNKEEQLNEMQKEMERRMRAMRFHSLSSVHPRLYFNAPFPHYAMPMHQLFVPRLPVQKIPFQFRLPFPQTRNDVGKSWNVGFSNDMKELQDSEPDSAREEGRILDPIVQGNYDQEESQVKFPEISLDVNRGTFNEKKQNALSDQSQVLKIEDSRVLEGLPRVNTGYVDSSNPGLDGNTKALFIPDPRNVVSQWPSGLPGLERAARLDEPQREIYRPIFGRFYQDAKEQYNDKMRGDRAGITNNVNQGTVRFYPSYPGQFTRIMFGSIQDKSGSSDGENVPYPKEMKLDDKTQRQILQKRNVLQRPKKPLKVAQKKESLGKSNGLDQVFGGKTKFKGLVAPEGKSYIIFKVKKMKNQSGNVGKKDLRKNKSGTAKHSSYIQRKERGRKARNFISTRYYGINPQSSFNFPSFPPFYAPPTSIPTSDTIAQFMATQTQVEDPITDIERQGYSIQSDLSRMGGFPSGWPLKYSAQLPNRGEEYSFPVGPPQSLLEVSKNVDRFPVAALFPSGGLAQRRAWYWPRVPTGDGDHSSAPETRQFQPNTVSAALSLFPYHQPLAFSPKQPFWQNTGNYPTGEKKTIQQEPKAVASPVTYTSPHDNSFVQNVQNTPYEDSPEFPEQRTQQFPEEPTKDTSENGPHEITENNEQGLNEEGEIFPQDSKEEYSVGDKGQDVPEETDLNFIPGLSGLENSQASLIKQQMERDDDMLQENAVTRQKGVEAPRTKANIQEGAFAGQNNRGLTSPTLSIASIEKMIDLGSTEDAKALYNMDAIHGYGSSSMRPAVATADEGAEDSHDFSEQAGHQENGKYAHSSDWESAPLSQGKLPPDFNLKLQNALSEWNAPVHPSHDSASSKGTLADNSPEKFFIAPQGSSDNPTVVPGFMFDTQGQRMVPLFLPNLPSELREDSNAETVLMVPPSVNKLKGHTETKKGKIKKKKATNLLRRKGSKE